MGDNFEEMQDIAGWSTFSASGGAHLTAAKQASRFKVIRGYSWYRPRWFHNLYGTMPAAASAVRGWSHTLQILNSMLRGIGQIVFMNNPATGLTIVVAIAVSSWYAACFMLLGATAGSLAAVILGFDRASMDAGLYAYNGALTGLCLAAFHHGSDDDPGASPQVLIPVALMGAISSINTVAIGAVVVAKLGLSPFTFPFNVAAWIWLAGSTGGQLAYFPLDGAALNASLKMNVASSTVHSISYDSTDVILGCFRGVGQVFFQESVAAGAIILIGMWLCSPISSAMGIFGSTLGTLTAVVLGAESNAVTAGLYGYNGCLTGVCIGGLFFVLKGAGIWLYLVLACVLSTILQAAMTAVLAPAGLPSLTFPFVLTCWIFCLTGQTLSAVFAVDLDTITVPEDHRRRWIFLRKVSSKFAQVNEVLKFYDKLDSADQLAQLETRLVPVLMCYFAYNGELDSIVELLDGGADVNGVDYDGRTAMHLAAAEGHTHIIECLLRDYAADPLAKDKWGRLPFDDALRSRNAESMRVTSVKSYPSTKNPVKSSLRRELGLAKPIFGSESELGLRLCLLAFNEDIAQITRLVRVGVPINSVDNDHRTALHVAASQGYETTCRVLLYLGADPTLCDVMGHTPENDARRGGFDQLADSIRDKQGEAPPPLTPLLGSNGLHSKFGSGVPQATIARDRMFLAAVLCDTAYTGDAYRFGQLCGRIDAEVLAAAADYDQRTPLHIAVESGHDEIVRLLLARNFPINVLDRWGHSPLVSAIIHKRENLIRLLRDSGAARVDSIISEVELALLMCDAIREKDHEMLRHFLLGGCSPNVRGYDGKTAMHVAAETGSAVASEMLKAAGGNLLLTDRWGTTATLPSPPVTEDVINLTHNQRTSRSYTSRSYASTDLAQAAAVEHVV